MKHLLRVLGFSSICVCTSAAAQGPSAPPSEAPPTARLPPGTMTSSEHTDAWKIANALAAAPTAIAENATVRDWPLPNGRVLRQGTNGWTCLPDLPGRPQHDPMCLDETSLKWMTAVMSHQAPHADRVGLSYMLLGEARADPDDITATKPPPGKNWSYTGPHVMVVLPDSSRDALSGVNRDITKDEPYVTAVQAPSPLWIIPVARGGELLRVYRP
ncbi:MAG TPA: hypothetical protein VF765_01695 [Polyangiaceae bacterium]